MKKLLFLSVVLIFVAGILFADAATTDDIRNITTITIGDPNSTSPLHESFETPFNYNSEASLVQHIYLASEMNDMKGLITQVTYFFRKGNGDGPEGVRHRIWMGTTSRANLFFGGWVSYDDFQLVYDDVLDIDFVGAEEIVFNLQYPFLYTEDNLVIMTQRHVGGGVSVPENNIFSIYEVFGLPRMMGARNFNYHEEHELYGFDPVDLDPAVLYNPVEIYLGSNAVVKLVFSGEEHGNLIGQITTGTPPTPVEGVTVTIDGTSFSTSTNSAGEFEFTLLEPGNISITGTKVGYFPATETDITIIAGDTTTRNMTMTLTPQVNVTGRILSNSNNAGLIGASVVLSGPITYPAVLTNSQGDFTIPNVSIDLTYTITITADGHVSYMNDEIIVGSDDLSIPDILLIAYSAIQGVVTTGEPAEVLSGVQVTLIGNDSSVLTDEDGFYAFTDILEETVNIRAEKVGYTTRLIENISLPPGQTITENISMSPIGQIIVSGRVLSSTDGLPLMGATVSITGPINYPVVTTNSEGLFTINNVTINLSYTLTVRTDGHYQHIIDPFEVLEDNINLPDITLNQAVIAPGNIIANIETGNIINLTWDRPVIPSFTGEMISQTNANTNADRFGVGATPNAMEIAHRFTAEELSEQGVSGLKLSHISFLYTQRPGMPNELSTLAVRVYNGGTGSPLSPGMIVHHQDVPVYGDNGDPLLIMGDYEIGDQPGAWNNIELDKDVFIPTSGEMWISIRYGVHTGFVAGVTPHNTSRNGFDNLVSYNNAAWGTMTQYSANPNSQQLLIRGYISGSDGNVAIGSDINTRAYTPTYNVYRALESDINEPDLWTTIATGLTETEYTDPTWASLDGGIYRYIVKTVSDGNISPDGWSQRLLHTAENEVYVGDPAHLGYRYQVPFDFWAMSSLSQQIYPESEINKRGLITHITYRFHSFGDIPIDLEVALYMGVTERTSFSRDDSWIPYSQFLPVYDGLFPTSLPRGYHDITIELDNPFPYTGGNLVVYTWRKMETIQYWSQQNTFHTSQFFDEDRVFFQNLDSAMDPLAPVGGSTLPFIPNIKLTFDDSPLGNIIGRATTGAAQTPLGNVLIKIEGTNRSTYTNANGYYEISHIRVGSVNVTASMHAYFDEVQTVNVIENQTTTLNFNMTERPLVTISGNILCGLNDIPVEGARVVLSGYNFYETTTNEQGFFSIANVYGGTPYTMIITKETYERYTDNEFVSGMTNTNIGNTYLKKRAAPPRNLSAIEAGNNQMVFLSWEEPDGEESKWITHMITDEFATGFGPSHGGPYSWRIANRFTPEQLRDLGVDGALLTKVAFHVAEGSFSNFTIEIYTGGTGSPLNPGNLVYTQFIGAFDIVSGEWNEIILDFPVRIPLNEEFWMGYFVDSEEGMPSSNTDRGFGNTDYGDIVQWNDEWTTTQRYGMNLNWMLKGFVEEAITRSIVLSPNDIIPDTYLTPTVASSNNDVLPALAAATELNTVHNTNIISTLSDNIFELLGFNIERAKVNEMNDESKWVELVTMIPDYGYFDDTWGSIEKGMEYVYRVQAVYTNNSPSVYIYSNYISHTLSEDNKPTVPIVTVLGNNYPNPFNPSTVIAFDIAKAGMVSIEIFNIRGQKVKTLINDILEIGHHFTEWNGTNDNERPVSSGIYFYRMVTDETVQTKRMLLLK